MQAMTGFQRYAIYHLPDDAKLASFGAACLGWDIAAGAPVSYPDIVGLKAATAMPRKYGFHGTLKPPFRLEASSTLQDLLTDLRAFCAQTKSVSAPGLRLASLGSFLALVPSGPAPDLDALAFSLVRRFDGYRQAPSVEELDRRRARGLTQSQERHLVRWGYPYVDTDFRFHLTLTGRLRDDQRDAIRTELERILPPLPDTFRLASVALAGEAASGQFHLIERLPLTG